MSDLAAFLRARIDEDEAAAWTAAPGPWTYGDIESIAGGTLYDGNVAIAAVDWDPVPAEVDTRIHRVRHEREADATGEHIARWNPARVLVEVEAKRRVIEQCRPIAEMDGWEYTDAPDLAEYVMRALAQPYADHPDFDPAWST